MLPILCFTFNAENSLSTTSTRHMHCPQSLSLPSTLFHNSHHLLLLVGTSLSPPDQNHSPLDWRFVQQHERLPTDDDESESETNQQQSLVGNIYKRLVLSASVLPHPLLFYSTHCCSDSLSLWVLHLGVLWVDILFLSSLCPPGISFHSSSYLPIQMSPSSPVAAWEVYCLHYWLGLANDSPPISVYTSYHWGSHTHRLLRVAVQWFRSARDETHIRRIPSRA